MPCPMPMIRASPMVLSGAAATVGLCRYLCLQPLLDVADDADDASSEGQAEIEGMLGPYVQRLLTRFNGLASAMYPATWLVAGVNLAVNRTQPARLLYSAGLALSVAHFAWTPATSDLFQRLGGLGRYRREKSARTKVSLLRAWMRLHVARTLVADVPAWLCFSAAFFYAKA